MDHVELMALIESSVRNSTSLLRGIAVRSEGSRRIIGKGPGFITKIIVSVFDVSWLLEVENESVTTSSIEVYFNLLTDSAGVRGLVNC